jgi:large conductance mechanosensitive channel
MLKEFKDFAMRGNLIDMAIAFVMGGAFGKLVSSFIDGIVMPPISLLTKGDIEGAIVIKQAVKDVAGEVTSPEVAITYGAFVSALITFIIVAFVMFLVVKAVNKMKKAEPAPAPAPAGPSETDLLAEIRDLLKNK